MQKVFCFRKKEWIRHSSEDLKVRAGSTNKVFSGGFRLQAEPLLSNKFQYDIICAKNDCKAKVHL